MRRHSLWKSPVLRILLGVLYGMLWMAAGTVLLAGSLLLGNVSARLLAASADVLWCIGAFAAGSRAGYHARLHGIRTGLLCGLLMSSILLVFCISIGAVVSARVLIRCAMLCIAGICGGIRGVNIKITKPPY